MLAAAGCGAPSMQEQSTAPSQPSESGAEQIPDDLPIQSMQPSQTPEQSEAPLDSVQPEPSPTGQSAKPSPSPQKTQKPSASPSASAEKPSVTPSASASQEAKPSESKTPETDDTTITCTISISCKAAYDGGFELAGKVSNQGTILGSTKVSVEKGASVYDVLKKAASAKGIPIAKTGGGKGVYVSAINSIGEGDCGPKSGWLYYVNGQYASKGCGAYEVKDGDKIQWKYTLE